VRQGLASPPLGHHAQPFRRRGHCLPRAVNVRCSSSFTTLQYLRRNRIRQPYKPPQVERLSYAGCARTSGNHPSGAFLGSSIRGHAVLSCRSCRRGLVGPGGRACGGLRGRATRHSFRWLGRGADAPRLATGRLCVRPLQGGSTTRCTTLLITPWRCRGMWAAAAHAGTRRSSRRRTRVPPLCSGCLVQRQISLLGLDSEWCLVKLRRTFRWPLPCLSGTDHTVFPRALGGQRPGGPS
jgi:hypothetical protein